MPGEVGSQNLEKLEKNQKKEETLKEVFFTLTQSLRWGLVYRRGSLWNVLGQTDQHHLQGKVHSALLLGMKLDR